MNDRSTAVPSDPGSSDNDAGTTIGKRQPRLLGVLRAPTAQERAWVCQMASRETRVPKGVFRYRTMAEANADWERWCVELVAATVSPSRQA